MANDYCSTERSALLLRAHTDAQAGDVPTDGNDTWGGACLPRTAPAGRGPPLRAGTQPSSEAGHARADRVIHARDGARPAPRPVERGRDVAVWPRCATHSRVNRWTRKEDNATRLRFGPFVRAQPGRTDKDDRRVRTSSAWGIIFHRGELVSTGSPTRVFTPSLSSPPVAVSPWLAPVGASGRFI
jgi:hypothetical protein